MIKSIIFDFDGVLVESFDIKTKAFARLFESEGWDVVREVVSYHVMNGGVSRFEKFKYIYKNIIQRKLTDEIFHDLCGRFQNLVVEEVIRAPYVKGAKEFLDSAKERYKFFICSGTPQDELEMIIEKKGMGRYFSSLYGSPEKKDVIVRAILKKNSYKSDDVLYVGDALSDYEAACSNGIFFVGRALAGNNVFGSLCDIIPDLTFLQAAIGRIENKIRRSGQ